ncbi:hypothetical protein CGLO_00480 [Colletotrichum gloeosporioides Cg-14]|uniref:Uncharacterized protein n=1 Tax=Colletotrichum gloeosporioides (strain Cg-14) TaxID=1237896 RepID=T0MDU6_COLGC|nr:hypothetical protein CGLO_00480 [Colletotrichum gloeosporioides Cg-14]
MLNVLAED